MSEMVGIVARALYAEESKYGPLRNIPSWEQVTGRHGYFEDLARAAIKALREPTHEMLEAEVVAYNSRKKPLALRAGECLWQAMIDAALK